MDITAIGPAYPQDPAIFPGDWSNSSIIRPAQPTCIAALFRAQSWEGTFIGRPQAPILNGEAKHKAPCHWSVPCLDSPKRVTRRRTLDTSRVANALPPMAFIFLFFSQQTQLSSSERGSSRRHLTHLSFRLSPRSRCSRTLRHFFIGVFSLTLSRFNGFIIIANGVRHQKQVDTITQGATV